MITDREALDAPELGIETGGGAAQAVAAGFRYGGHEAVAGEQGSVYAALDGGRRPTPHRRRLARRARAIHAGESEISDLLSGSVDLVLVDGQTALQHHLDGIAHAELNLRAAGKQNGRQAESATAGAPIPAAFAASGDGPNAGSGNRRADNGANILSFTAVALELFLPCP